MAAVESWFAPAAIAEPLPARRPRRRAPESRRTGAAQARERPRRRFRVRAPLVWMVVFALLLAGVVAVNVAVLRANVAVHKLDQTIAQLQQRNQTLASRYSAATSAPRVEAAARRAGLIQAPALSTDYLDLLGR